MTDIQRGIWHTPPEGMKPTGYFPAQLQIYSRYLDRGIQIRVNNHPELVEGELVAVGDQSVDVDDGHTTHIVRYDEMVAYLALPERPIDTSDELSG